MQDDIFKILMLILLLENSGCSENINQLVIMFLLMQNRSGSTNSCGDRCHSRSDDDGYTF